MGNFFYWLFKKIRHHIWLSRLIFVLLIIGAGISASQLKLEENILAIIPQDEKITEMGQTMEDLKMNNRLVVHLFSQDTSQTDADKLISTANSLADSLRSGSGAYVDSILLSFPDSQIEALYTHFYENLPFYLMNEDYQKISERLSPEGTDEAIERFYRSLMSPMGTVTKKLMIRDPLGLASFPLERARELQVDDNISIYRNHLLTKDRNHLIFFINLKYPSNETAHNGKLIDDLNDLIDRFGTENPSIAIEYFGTAAVAVANASRIKRDILITVTLALIGLFIFITLFYRSFTTFFLVVTPGVFGALLAVGFLALVKDSVSIISLAVGSVLLGVTIDYALHFLTHYKSQKDVGKLFLDLGFPTLICGITTAFAFLSLLFIRSNALQDLGIFAAISVIGASLYTLIVLPQFVIRKKPVVVQGRQLNLVERFITFLAKYPLHKKPWAIGIFIGLTILSLFTWKAIGFESDMLSLNYMPESLARYEQHINAISNYSANSIYVAVPGQSMNAALENNRALEERLRELENQDQIYGYLSLNKMIPSPGLQQERIKKWKNYWEENDPAEIYQQIEVKAGELGFQEGTFSTFRDLMLSEKNEITESDIDRVLDIFGDELVIYQENGKVTLLSTVQLPLENKPRILEELGKIPGILILDKGYLMSRLVTLLAEDFNILVNISLVLVFLILLITYGRIELSLIAFIPILLSWLWVLGLMGMLGLQFNIVNVIICTFIFGLGIDYSIFLLRGLLQEYSTGLKHILSYKKSIILSSVTTLTGIGVLIFAKHPALQSIALLAIIGILSVIFITFTLQPLLFHFLIGRRKQHGAIPFTAQSFIFTCVAFFYFLFGCLILYILRLIFLLPIGSVQFRKACFHWMLMIFCRSLIYLMFNLKKVVVDRDHADYTRPAVIISNHHSFIDILIMLMFHPKTVIVTNDWVYSSPFFGKTVQFADFIQASRGLDEQLSHIAKLVADGFSIVVFPEGSRSGSADLRRFHKGAFFLAEKFELDIQPVLLHGTSMVMPKGDDFMLKNNRLTIKFLPRIPHADLQFGRTYSDRTKSISRHFKSEYETLREGIETPYYFREILVKNYIYKGPVLEWYLRIKLRFENHYCLFHERIPRNARIVDLGCGYGFMSYALGFSSAERNILGIDYDERKISIAKECPVKPKNVQFTQGDVVHFNHGSADVFLISDVLHYLLKDEQMKILENMLTHLNPGGTIIIRDGDSTKTKRHKGSVMTEIFSTNSGFNQVRNELNFISSDLIENFAAHNRLDLEIIDQTKRTSNLIFVLKRKN